MRQYLALYNGNEIKPVKVIREFEECEIQYITFVDSVGVTRTWRKEDRAHSIQKSWAKAQQVLIAHVQKRVDTAKNEIIYQKSRLATIKALEEPPCTK